MTEKHWAILGVVVALIIGGSILGSQKMKQDSIEGQQREKIRAEEAERLQQERKDMENRNLLNICIDGATQAYWEYMKINGTENEDGTIWALDRYWESGKKDKQDAIDNCYRKYN